MTPGWGIQNLNSIWPVSITSSNRAFQDLDTVDLHYKTQQSLSNMSVVLFKEIVNSVPPLSANKSAFFTQQIKSMLFRAYLLSLQGEKRAIRNLIIIHVS